MVISRILQVGHSERGLKIRSPACTMSPEKQWWDWPFLQKMILQSWDVSQHFLLSGTGRCRWGSFCGQWSNLAWLGRFGKITSVPSWFHGLLTIGVPQSGRLCNPDGGGVRRGGGWWGWLISQNDWWQSSGKRVEDMELQDVKVRLWVKVSDS